MLHAIAERLVVTALEGEVLRVRRETSVTAHPAESLRFCVRCNRKPLERSDAEVFHEKLGSIKTTAVWKKGLIGRLKLSSSAVMLTPSGNKQKRGKE
jgi:hypothetical protein